MPSTRTKHRLRKFRFERPQKIAAALLFLLLVQCLWASARRPLSEKRLSVRALRARDLGAPLAAGGLFHHLRQYPRRNACVSGGGAAADGGADLAGQASTTSTWEMRHEVGAIKFLLRLPFLLAGLALGACLWWVTRRLFGNEGGYISLALYCFMPDIVRACTTPNNEILAAFGLFSVIYTAIGVGHALQGPRRKWRPRIVLLTLALGFTAAAHIAAFVLALLFTIAFMAWVAEGRRGLYSHVIIKVSRSTSRRICEWYWDTSRGSTTTWSSSASAMARRPASGVRRSWLTQATSSRRLRLQGPLPGPGLGQPLVCDGQSFGELGEFGRQRQLRGYVDAALADTLHRRGKRPASHDEPVAHEQGDHQPGQPGNGHQVQYVVALGRGAHHAVGDDAHPAE